MLLELPNDPIVSKDVASTGPSRHSIFGGNMGSCAKNSEKSKVRALESLNLENWKN